MKSKSKWIVSLMLLPLFMMASLMVKANQEIEESNENKYTPFTIYYLMSNQLDEIMNKNLDLNKIGTTWTTEQIIPKLDPSTNSIIGAYVNGADVSNPNLEILFDKNYLHQYLLEALNCQIDEYWILDCSSSLNCYVVMVKHDNTMSFMTILINGYEIYGEFENKKIYSWDEFSWRCRAKPCTLIINNKLINCDQPPIVQYNKVLFPLRIILENLGFQVDWDEETENVIFTKGNDKCTYITNMEKNYSKSILKNGISKSGGDCTIVNGRTMVDGMFLGFLTIEYNIYFKYDADTNIVRITVDN